MNRTIEYLSIFGVGVAAGVLGASGYFKDKYKTIADEEIESVKEVYRRKQEQLSKDISKEKEEKSTVIFKPVPTTEITENTVFGYSIPTAGDSTDYRKFYENDDSDDDEEETIEVRMAEKEAPSEVDRPYLITDTEYSETELAFDKMSCTFYVPDGILVDDLSREVVEQYVYGEDNVEYLTKTDEGIVYIRNEKLGCDLEISRDMNSIEESGDRVWFG